MHCGPVGNQNSNPKTHGIENRREHLGDGLLDHTVGDRGRSCKFAKHAHAAAGLGYLHPSHRLRPVSPTLKLLAQRWPVCACMIGPVLHGHAVYARSKVPVLCSGHLVAFAVRGPQLARFPQGRIWFSRWLLSIGTSPSSKKRVSAAQRFRL